jgi:hypothetical protein
VNLKGEANSMGRINGSRVAFSLAIVFFLLIFPGVMTSSARQRAFVVDKFFKEDVGLNNGQIDSIHRGKAVATSLDTSNPNQVFIFGATYIDAAPESYLKLANDFDAMRKLPGYLAIQKFSDPPRVSDLAAASIEADDLKELKNCKPSDCEVQLPSESMEQFRKSVNWNSPDAASQADRLAKQMIIDAILAYQKGGNAALGVYRDKDNPTRISDAFQSLLGRLKALPVYLPELSEVLLDYPVDLPNAQSEFYWEKVDFGLKPTLRVVQQITYRGGTPPAHAVALKQLYANHYFQTALDLTVCVKDAAHPSEHGFYLITMKASQQDGLTGLKGSIVRSQAVGKSRSSLERTLNAIKQRLEANPR